MSASFTDMQDVWLRFKHADRQLRQLQLETSQWVLANDSRVMETFNRDLSRFEFRLMADFPPRRLGLLLGDVLHGYRSTLDNLFHQLLKRDGATMNTKAAFRICASFSGDQATRHRKESQGLRSADKDVIDSFQPREWGELADVHPLHLLDRFSNADKHRVLIPSVAGHRLMAQSLDKQLRPIMSLKRLQPNVSHKVNIPNPRIVQDGRFGGFSIAHHHDDPALLLTVNVSRAGPTPRVVLSRRFDLHVAWYLDDVSFSVDHLGEVSRTIRELIVATEASLVGAGNVPSWMQS